MYETFIEIMGLVPAGMEPVAFVMAFLVFMYCLNTFATFFFSIFKG